MAVLLALLSSVLWGGADFLGGTVSRRRMAVLVVGVGQLAGLVVVTAVALPAGAFGDDTGYLPWAVGAGVAGLVGLVCFYAALATGTMGVVSPIAALGVAVPVLVGLARGERPGATAMVGMALAVAGLLLASGPELSGADRAAGLRPLLLALVAAVGFGFALLLIAEGARTSTLMTLVTMRVTSVTVLAVVLVLAVRRVEHSRLLLDRRDLALVCFVGVCDVAANLTFGLASNRGLLSLVGVLGSLYPVVTVLLAKVVLGEQMGRLQTMGVAAALGGVALIAAG